MFIKVAKVLASAGVAVALGAAASGPSGPKPVGEMAWFTSDDYPAVALRAEEQGMVVFRLTIDATGAVTSCVIVSSSGSSALDATTCDLAMRRAHFIPARDSHGEALPSDYTRRANWRLPKDVPAPLTAFSATATVDVAKANVVISCKVDLLGGGSPLLPTNLCETVPTDPILLGRMKGPLGDQRATVLLQVMLLPDGAPRFPLVHKRPDVSTVGLGSAHFDIAPDGTIAACEPIDMRGIIVAQQMCDEPPTRQFEAAPAGSTKLRGMLFLVSESVLLGK